jgi:capsular exopolysaccharide synthesis family protein
LGAALAFGLEYLDYTVKSPEELEDLLGQSIMGAVGVIQPMAGQGPQKAQGEGPSSDLIVLTDPRSPLAEAYRSLRTNLRFSGLGTKTRGVVVTSAAPGEGKSVTAANLAVVFAQAGRRVILVDADLRRPTVHRRFRLPNSVGLSDLLIDENATSPEVIQSYLQPGPVENLQIMTSGPIPPNPAELLSADWVLGIFDAVEAQADIVIWDTPPALTVTDALILAARSGATLQVVRAGSTRRDLIKRTREVLQRVDAHVLAPILNQVQAADIGYYQYYYYRGYKYGEPAPGERSRSSSRSSRRSAPEASHSVAPNAHGTNGQPSHPVGEGHGNAPARPAPRPSDRSAAQRLFGRG